MEDNSLKAAWKGMSNTPANTENIRKMIQESNHPVQQQIRKQLIIETIAFTLVLVVYYNIFDGHEKPVYANVLLVAALILTILHNIIGYLFSRQRFGGDNIAQSLAASVAKWRTYAISAVASRAATAACLLIFFTAIIQFTPAKTWILVGAIAVFIVQLVLLSRLWSKRISQLKAATGFFKD